VKHGFFLWAAVLFPSRGADGISKITVVKDEQPATGDGGG
jgi:hypothetical protein